MVARTAAHLTVLQRTPSCVVPARNHKLDPEFQRAIKARYAELRTKQYESRAGFIPLAFLDNPHPAFNAMDVTAGKREAVYDACWAAGGSSFYIAFKDLLFDPAANQTCANYVRGRVREAVKDPVKAGKRRAAFRRSTAVRRHGIAALG